LRAEVGLPLPFPCAMLDWGEGIERLPAPPLADERVRRVQASGEVTFACCRQVRRSGRSLGPQVGSGAGPDCAT
jgi:hypothetical protein